MPPAVDNHRIGAAVNRQFGENFRRLADDKLGGAIVVMFSIDYPRVDGAVPRFASAAN